VRWKGTTYTAAQFIASVDTTGLLLLPAFIHCAPLAPSNDFDLAGSDTIAANQGADLSSMFSTDLDHVNRPQGSGWDRGPLERVGG
jgi:hypothetical protein